MEPKLNEGWFDAESNSIELMNSNRTFKTAQKSQKIHTSHPESASPAALVGFLDLRDIPTFPYNLDCVIISIALG